MRGRRRTRPSGQVWFRDSSRSNRPSRSAGVRSGYVPRPCSARSFSATGPRPGTTRAAGRAGSTRRSRPRARRRPRPGPGNWRTPGSCPASSTPPTSAGPPAPPRSSRAHLECPVIPDEGLRERNGGEWQGRTARRDRDGLAGHARGVAPGRAHRAARRRDRQPAARRASTTAITRAIAHVGRNTLVVVTHHGVRARASRARRASTDARLIPNLGGFWFDERRRRSSSIPNRSAIW